MHTAKVYQMFVLKKCFSILKRVCINPSSLHAFFISKVNDSHFDAKSANATFQGIYFHFPTHSSFSRASGHICALWSALNLSDSSVAHMSSVHACAKVCFSLNFSQIASAAATREPEKQTQEARGLDLVILIFTIRIRTLRNPLGTNSCTSPVPPIWSCWAPAGRKWVSPSGTFLKRSGNFCSRLCFNVN